MGFLDFGACPDLDAAPCVGSFVDLLDDPTKAAIVAAINSTQKQIRAEAAKVAAVAASASGAIDALQGKINKIDLEISAIQAALNPLDNFLAEFPCPELLPLQSVLNVAKSSLEASKGLIDLTGLSAAVDNAISQRDTLNGVEACLSKFKEKFV